MLLLLNMQLAIKYVQIVQLTQYGKLDGYDDADGFYSRPRL